MWSSEKGFLSILIASMNLRQMMTICSILTLYYKFRIQALVLFLMLLTWVRRDWPIITRVMNSEHFVSSFVSGGLIFYI